MALLAFYGGLVIGVAVGMGIMALLVISRSRERTQEHTGELLQER